MSIEGIALENSSAAPKAGIKSSTISCQSHALFHSFLSDDSKQDAATTTAHRKRFISLLKYRKLLTTSLSTIWENTDGCAEPYRCASALNLMSVMSQCYSIIIDQGISTPGYGKEVVDVLNDVDKRYIYQLMSSVQLPGSSIFYSQIQMHTSNQKDDVSLEKLFQHHLTKEHRKNGDIYQV